MDGHCCVLVGGVFALEWERVGVVFGLRWERFCVGLRLWISVTGWDFKCCCSMLFLISNNDFRIIVSVQIHYIMMRSNNFVWWGAFISNDWWDDCLIINFGFWKSTANKSACFYCSRIIALNTLSPSHLSLCQQLKWILAHQCYRSLPKSLTRDNGMPLTTWSFLVLL